jgi:hypothetical protein
MEREYFLKQMNAHYDALMELKGEKSFYSFEKKFEELWLGAGRGVMEKVISEPGANRRKKKR